MRTIKILLLLGMVAAATGCRSSAPAAVSASPVEQVDKYQWLEDVQGERSIAWVKAHNARSEEVLEERPAFCRVEGIRVEDLRIARSFTYAGVERGNGL